MYYYITAYACFYNYTKTFTGDIDQQLMDQALN